MRMDERLSIVGSEVSAMQGSREFRARLRLQEIGARMRVSQREILRDKFDIDDAALHEFQLEFGAGSLLLLNQRAHFRSVAGNLPRIALKRQCGLDRRA